MYIYTCIHIDMLTYVYVDMYIWRRAGLCLRCTVSFVRQQSCGHKVACWTQYRAQHMWARPIRAQPIRAQAISTQGVHDGPAP